jgi:hypothetical protein
VYVFGRHRIILETLVFMNFITNLVATKARELLTVSFQHVRNRLRGAVDFDQGYVVL